MTIVIAAITGPNDTIVCVSDRMISYGDVFQTHDNAVLKHFRLNDQWEVAWAANDVNLIQPIVLKVHERLAARSTIRWDGTQVARLMSDAYSETLQEEFVATHLSRFGYTTLEQFRREGRADLGDQFAELCGELARFNLGAAFVLFGHDREKKAKLYEIQDPGHVSDRNLLKLAIVGSGHDMAMASLHWPPPMTFLLEDTIYRLLEAKFSAEKASGVGQHTTVLLLNREGVVRLLSASEIERIREIWRKEVADVPSPPAAIELLEKSRALRDIEGGER